MDDCNALIIKGHLLLVKTISQFDTSPSYSSAIFNTIFNLELILILSRNLLKSLKILKIKNFLNIKLERSSFAPGPRLGNVGPIARGWERLGGGGAAQNTQLAAAAHASLGQPAGELFGTTSARRAMGLPVHAPTMQQHQQRRLGRGKRIF